MTRPAEVFRQNAQIIWPGANVVGRGRSWLKHQHPTNLNQFMLDVSIAPIHYGINNDQEIDTAWEVDTGAWQYRMIKAGYNLHARNILNVGDIIQWSDPASGESVTLQPLGLNWVDNVTNSRQQIALPQAIVVQVINGDILHWQDGYGAGIHFRYQADVSKLIKQIIIDNATNLPIPTVVNPYLEVEFIISKSVGVTLYVDGTPWDNSTQTVTANAIEYRLSNGTVVWSFTVPQAFDSNFNSTKGIFQLRRQGNNRYCTVRFPKSWIDTAVFPITLDPTIEETVATGNEDGYQEDVGTSAVITGPSYYIRATPGGGYNIYGAAHWPTVDGPASGNTITAGYISLYIMSANIDLYADLENVDDAAALAETTNNISGRTLTGNAVQLTSAGNSRLNTPSMVNAIQAVINRAGWNTGQSMTAVFTGASSTGGQIATYEISASWTPILHIEYSSGDAIPKKIIMNRYEKVRQLAYLGV